ncbi:MAG: cadherin-like beta sandwich domain-containing protein [Firmicutes bacterium]|nr:cadherin-like beta sandwich domain-containing protein [Bacillota bacterium]
MKKINCGAKKFVAFALIVMFLLSISPGALAAIAEGTNAVGSEAEQSVDSSVEQVVYAINEDLTAIVSTNVSLGTGYGSNGKFMAPIDTPAAGAIAISNRAELEAIRNNLSGSYYLIADIDLSGVEWVPINPFAGSFDGQGHVISNLTITGNGSGYGGNGLFGSIYNGGTVKNVGMENTVLNINVAPSSDHAYAGGICGFIGTNSSISNCYNVGEIMASSNLSSSRYAFAGGICGFGETNFSINNCYNIGTVTASSYSLISYAGGVCGHGSSNFSISNCYNTGTVTASSYNSGSYAGGIYGGSNNSINDTITISNCYNAGAVTAISTNSDSQAGGICGYSGTDSSISNCYNTGAVAASSTRSFAGGICGFCNTSYSVTNCYNMGTVTATSTVSYSYAGGICGIADCSTTNCYNMGAVTATSTNYYSFAGGICGYCGYIGTDTNSSISTCYNAGTVTASPSSSYMGGICGFGDLPNISNCYCLNLYGSPYGIKLTNSQMCQQAFFVGFNFDTVWVINQNLNNGYPYLQNLRPAQSANYTMNVTSGPGGAISGAPSGQYAAGEQINLTATADANYVFDHWTANGVTLADVNTPAITFTMPANPVTLTANFIPHYTYTVTGTLSGLGAGFDYSSLAVNYTLDGGETMQQVVAPDGSYNINVLDGANLVITPPDASGYTVAPPTINLPNVTADSSGNDFVYTPTISLVTHTVFFRVFDGNYSIGYTQSVTDGDSINWDDVYTNYPADSASIKYWCDDTTGNPLWDPAMPITKDITLFPVFNKLSADATLANLDVSAGTLNPAFDSNITDYTVAVDSNISNINITATANNDQATVVGAGTKTLVTGANSFDVTITAENGATKTYTITVIRAANNNSITVNGVKVNYTIVNGVAVLQPTQVQMSAILNASGSNIVFNLSGQNAVDLYVGAGWFKNIDKTITIITSGGSASVKTKSLWNNSGKTRLVTIRNNKIDFKNI